MRQNEQPFLADPTQLEFPNDTWVAQDIRKAMLIFQAAELSPSQAAQYQAKGQEWLNEVEQHIEHSKTKHFARIQIILLQNHGPQQAKECYESKAFSETDIDYGEAPKLSTVKLGSDLLGKSITGLLEFRPKREKAWLDARLNRS
jgi:hypothetical protein